MASAATTTTHTIHAEIPNGETALRLDITYSYRREGNNADMQAMKVVPVDPGMDVIPGFYREMADEWLNDEGFFAARDLAEHERHGDYE